MPRLLDLCCGSKSVSKYFEAQGRECVTVDIDSKFEPTLIEDVLNIDPPNTWNAGEFDVVWCSPPCTFFSIARTRAPRDFRSADQIVLACWVIIRHLTSDPTKNVWYFMENPASGYLKTRWYMQEFEAEKQTLCYCKYGCPYKKSTNVWSYLDWEPRPMCKKWFLCLSFVDNHHPQTAQKGPRKLKTGMIPDDDYTSEQLYSIPQQLVAELFASISGR